MFRYLPEQASEVAPAIDSLHNLITDLSVFFTVAIVGAMLYFAIRYRRRNGVDHETPRIEGSHLLEVLWTVVPTIICIIIAYQGIIYFKQLREVPADALQVDVKAHQWQWDFEYANGKKTYNEAVIPVDKAVKFVLSSSDVLHSFFIPAMRVKSDAVPGMYTYVTFKPIKTGEYHIFCTEYCGTSHSAMLAKLRVVSQAEYQRWVSDRSEEEATAAMGPALRGKALYTQKACATCHSLNGTRVVGPSFLKLFGREERLVDGTKLLVDENYIKESILMPNAKLVESYPPNVMPAFAGQLSDDDITALIAFIKSQDGSQVADTPVAAPAAAAAADRSKMSPAERGKLVYQEKACVGCHSLDGTKMTGPTFKGIFGRSEKLSDGTSIVVNEEYLRTSIINPMGQVVEGYPPAMPPNMRDMVSDDEIKDVIEFLKTVK